MVCSACGRSNPKRASFCMHCGSQIKLPAELQALADTTAALRLAESAYWQAVRKAHAAGHSFRVLDEYGAHSYTHYSRMVKKGDL